jgi:ribosomal-protein-alanine N-acetyltransferase
MGSISTTRLELIPLTQAQLELWLLDIPALEKQIGLMIADGFVTERVQRAIRMKVEKMRKAEPSEHVWLTYWLIVIKEKNIGAGMLGFKGYPNKEGSTEIGYGIASAYQNKGYMSEAVQALIDWAFSHPFCTVITATEVENPSSRRLLEKLRARLVDHTGASTSWEIQKH